jgi:putative toxin-antitoxin system antitoxin component (TIGR02293 family)
LEFAMQVQEIVNVMGGRAMFGRAVTTALDLQRGIGEGVKLGALDRVVGRIYTDPMARRSLMNRVVPQGTLKRRLREGRLSPAESERTARLANVIAHAEYVWRNEDDARQWLITPHPELGDRLPIDVAVDEFGTRHVEDILDAILHGLPA